MEEEIQVKELNDSNDLEEYECPEESEEGEYCPHEFAGVFALFVAVFGGVTWLLRCLAEISGLFAWGCITFSVYWMMHRLGGVFVYLDADAGCVLWSGIVCGLVFQLVCYVCYRGVARICFNEMFSWLKSGEQRINTLAGLVSFFIKLACGLVLLIWPLLVFVCSFRLFRELNFSTGHLMGIMKECLEVWSLPVFLFALLGGNYLFLDVFFGRMLQKRRR